MGYEWLVVRVSYFEARSFEVIEPFVPAVHLGSLRYFACHHISTNLSVGSINHFLCLGVFRFILLKMSPAVALGTVRVISVVHLVELQSIGGLFLFGSFFLLVSLASILVSQVVVDEPLDSASVDLSTELKTFFLTRVNKLPLILGVESLE